MQKSIDGFPVESKLFTDLKATAYSRTRVDPETMRIANDGDTVGYLRINKGSLWAYPLTTKGFGWLSRLYEKK